MTEQNLTQIERAEALTIIGQTMTTDRFSLRSRVQRLKAGLGSPTSRAPRTPAPIRR